MNILHAQYDTIKALLNWRVSLDIFLIAIFIFFLYHTLRTTGTWQIVLGLIIAAGVFFAARLLNLRGIDWIYSNLSQVLVLALIIIFQPELRKILERAASIRPKNMTGEGSKLAFILSDALAALAELRRGALIVIPGKESIKPWTSEGIHVDAIPSYPILMSIFDPHSSGHDGAVVMENGKISTIGVRLPLSKSGILSETLGTRHHAAMGLSEVTDALVIAVSEERGSITVFSQGEVQIFTNKAELAARLVSHWENSATYALPGMEGRNPKALLWEFAISLLLAFLFWSTVVMSEVEVREITFSVPVEYAGVPKNYALMQQEPSRINLRLKGPIAALDNLETTLRVTIDLSEFTPGTHTFMITSENVNVPGGVHLESAEPPSVQFTLEELVKKELTIKPNLIGSMADGLRLVSVEVVPSSIPAYAPSSLNPNSVNLVTTPINLEKITQDTEISANIIAPPEVKPVNDQWPAVKVKIAVRAG